MKERWAWVAAVPVECVFRSSPVRPLQGGGWGLRSGGPAAGGILIVVLWTLFILAALAVAVAAYVGGQVELARRLGDRALARQAARAGVDHAVARVMLETNGWEALTEGWANDPGEFRAVDCGSRMRWTALYTVEQSDGSVVTNFGLNDEQARIDLNLAREEVLVSLFKVMAGLSGEQAAGLARSVVRARTAVTPGASAQGGLDEDAWVDSGLGNGTFQSVHELLWVRGMTREILEKILPYCTVHGAGRVNLNTAGPGVLRVLASIRGQAAEGWERKILQFREQGGIFRTLSAAGVADASGEGAVLKPEDQAVLSGVLPFVTVTSDRFRGIVVAADADAGPRRAGITFVWDRRERRFLYWYED